MIVGVAPRIRARGWRKIIPRTIMAAPMENDRTKPLAAMVRASSISLFPSFIEIKLPDPCPQKNPKACMMAISGKTTPTAAVAWVDICPTKKASARL